MKPLSSYDRRIWRKIALLGLVMVIAILLQYSTNHLQRTNEVLFGDTTLAGSASEFLPTPSSQDYPSLLLELLLLYAPGALMPALTVLISAEVLLPNEHFIRQRVVMRLGEAALFMGLVNVVLVSYGTLFAATSAELQTVVRLYHLVWIIQLLMLNGVLLVAGTSLWQTQKLPRWLSATLLIAPLLAMPMILLRIDTQSALAFGMMAALPTQIAGLLLFSFMGVASLGGHKAKPAQGNLSTQGATYLMKVRPKA
jgi:hypothetical protein